MTLTRILVVDDEPKITRLVRDYLERAGYGENFPHHSGHAYGLFQQEKPYFIPAETTPLEVGMIVTLEPGIYIPGLGGFRHSNTVLVTAGGCESLTHYPDSLEYLTLGRGSVFTRLNGALVRRAVGLKDAA